MDIQDSPGLSYTRVSRRPAKTKMLQAAAMILAAQNLSSDGSGSSHSSTVLKELRVDEKRFGKASPPIAQPLLVGKRGKGSRKNRKAAKAKLKPASEVQTSNVGDLFSMAPVNWESPKNEPERKYHVFVTGQLAPKDSETLY